MAKYKLTELASVIRSKNSGPYELTFDVIFKDFETFYKVKEAQAINKQNFCESYGIPESDVFHLVYFDPAKAVKVTIRRPIASGALGETDVYGAQQHAPLMAMEVEF
jgi:hypothetical protein